MITERRRSILAAVLLAILVATIPASLLAAHTAVRVPAWCTYPDSDGMTALSAAVGQHVAAIARYSPDQRPDRLTIQLDLMTQCAPFTG